MAPDKLEKKGIIKMISELILTIMESAG